MLEIQLSAEQAEALDCLLAAAEEEQVLCLTGPAGTGKTTLMRSVAQEFHQSRRPVVLATPTGKAAYNMAQKTGKAVRTLHRLLYSGVERTAVFPKEVDWASVPTEHREVVRQGEEADQRYVDLEQGKFFDTRRLIEVHKDGIKDPYHRFWSPTSNQTPTEELEFGGARHAHENEGV